MAEVAHGTLVDGRYLIKDRIGSGGMADVYSAEDRQLGRDVALKVLHRRFAQDLEFVERFRREASSAAGLQHPNVVAVFDRGEHDGTYYIAMENLRGRTLKQLIQDEAPLAQLRAIDLGIEILQAAGFAHKRGVIHRDFKPHNVIVGHDDQLKVTDFGIARAGASEMTETGSIMGTAQYLSPEQAQGHRVDASSDLYSIGVTIYEMLTRRVPFEGESAVAIALKHVSEPAPLLRTLRPDIHPALEAAVACSLEKDPARRYQSADQFIAALAAARSEILSGGNGQGTALFAPPVGEPPPDRRGRRWPFVVLALVLLAIGAAAVALQLVQGVAQVTVPPVTSEPSQQAAQTLVRVGLKPTLRGVSSSAKRGTVVGESPRAGTSVDRGSSVALTVSTGAAEVLVPPVAGDSQDQATSTLTQAGLRPTIDMGSSNAIAKGYAISTSPQNGALVRKGSVVHLLVSSGPPPVTVPGVVGQSQGSATAALTQAGLAVTTVSAYSDQPTGTVTAQDPPPGSSVAKGTQVTLTISKGKQMVGVPDVTGKKESDARKTLEGQGFAVRTTNRSSSQTAGTVISQNPGGGSRAAKGSTVTITIASAPKNSGGTPAPGGSGGGTPPSPGTPSPTPGK